MNCEKCAWANVTTDEIRTIIQGKNVITQNGKVNISCTNTEDKSINMVNDDMVCSKFKERIPE